MMEELLRKKLLESRNEFEKIKEEQKFKKFSLEVVLSFDDSNNVVIVMKNIAVQENDTNIYFGKSTEIKTGSEDMSIFIELLKYAEERYGSQFNYAIHPIIYCFFGNGMNTQKMEYILNQFKDNKITIKGKFGFVISEAIF